MKATYQISIYHDTRRPLKSGKYPVKLRLFTNRPRRQKLYPTEFELSPKDFTDSWEAKSPRGDNKTLKKQIAAVELHAVNIAKELKPFTLSQFEKRLFRKTGDGTNLRYLFDQAIQEFSKHRQAGSANHYQRSSRSLLLFTETHKRKYDRVTLYDITPNWLKDYQQFMLDRGLRASTIGIYLRPLRAIYNHAISNNEIDPGHYPFQRRKNDGKFQIPTAQGSKKALSKEELAKLYHTVPKTEKQQLSKDFWFFSYACNGMNFKDIALLKYKDIQDDKITFFRAKTIRTAKRAKLITSYLNDFTRSVIENYSTPDKSPDNYVFDILAPGISGEEELRRVRAFSNLVNWHMKKLCRENGLSDSLSPVWGRHTYATNSVRNGASLEYVMEQLGHSNLSTTQRYFDGFDDDVKKEFAKSLMNF